MKIFSREKIENLRTQLNEVAYSAEDADNLCDMVLLVADAPVDVEGLIDQMGECLQGPRYSWKKDKAAALIAAFLEKRPGLRIDCLTCGKPIEKAAALRITMGAPDARGNFRGVKEHHHEECLAKHHAGMITKEKNDE